MIYLCIALSNVNEVGVVGRLEPSLAFEALNPDDVLLGGRSLGGRPGRPLLGAPDRGAAGSTIGGPRLEHLAEGLPFAVPALPHGLCVFFGRVVGVGYEAALAPDCFLDQGAGWRGRVLVLVICSVGRSMKFYYQVSRTLLDFTPQPSIRSMQCQRK